MTIIQKTIKAKIMADIYSYLAEEPGTNKIKQITQEISEKYFINPKMQLVEQLRILILHMAEQNFAEKIFELELKKQGVFKKIEFKL